MSPKVVVITGCSAGGIGFNLCQEFLSRGHTVFAASRNLSKTEGLPEEVHRVELDVNSEASIATGVAQIMREAGRIDILINNAGQGCVAPMIEVSMATFRQTFNVNVFGMVAMVQACAPHMVKQRSGTIVNIGSIVAWTPTPWAGVYCASKAAVHSISDTMRMELRGFGVRVMCVAPGAIKSGIGAANDTAAILNENSVYKNVEAFVRSRGSWSQTIYSTPTHTLAATIAANALAHSPPSYLATGYRSTLALISYYLPTLWKDYFWGSQFGTGRVGQS